MAEVIQLVPATRFVSAAGEGYEQPIANALDVSAYSCVTVDVSVFDSSLTADTDLYLQTAMKNGEEYLKTKCAFVTDLTNDEDGVADFTEKHFL